MSTSSRPTFSPPSSPDSPKVILQVGKRDWTAAREKVELEGGCRVCKGSPADAAHIIPRSRVPGPEAMAQSNIVPLCRPHHVAFDDRRLDLLPFLSVDEQAFAVFLVGMIEAYTYICGQPPVLREFA